jgi:quinol monooxygenase YgiN
MEDSSRRSCRRRSTAQAAAHADATFCGVAASGPPPHRRGRRVAARLHDTTIKQDGCISVEAFEQVGRAGHWVIVETWREQKAFDARDASVQQRLIDSTKAIRVSGFDQRPYKTIAVAAARPGASGNAVSVIASGVKIRCCK